MHNGPPKLLEQIVGALLPASRREDVLGDLYEKYQNPVHYLATALCVVPSVIAGQMGRRGAVMNLMKPVTFVVVLVLAAALALAVGNRSNGTRATYSEFLQQVQSGQVTKAVIVAGNSGANPITYSLKDGSRENTILPKDYGDVLATLQQKMVNIEIQDAAWQWLRVMSNAAPFFALLGFWCFTMWLLRRRGAR
jgi:ATP-dependent Zn protease